MTDWRARAERLSEELTDKGVLRSPRLRRAVAEVLRHEFVPSYFDYHSDGWRKLDRSGPEGRERWLARVYSNAALFILPEGRSSSSMPGLMVRMLESLNLQDGSRVLEIGTGSGYNAALLCHRLGADNVYSIDIEPELVSLARDRLARLGYQPTLAVGDGESGLAQYGPYDRIVATCSVPSVPWSWVQQTSVGGLIHTDVKTSGHAGNLVLLQRGKDRAEGHFSASYGSFMAMRHGERQLPHGEPALNRTHAESRPTTLDLPRPWEEFVFWFFAHVYSTLRISSYGQGMDPHTGQPGNAHLIGTDSSWCEISASRDSDGKRTVWQSGPRQLWNKIEAAHQRWHELGQPGWQRFGLTVTENHQTVWLDSPTSHNVWPLPQDDPTLS
jgi:protein-L-isoaspartate(D-aspartate) O-methyltransferase